MKNIFIYLFFGVCLLLSSCAAKKNTSSELVVIERDTLSYVLPSENKLTITQLCDSLNNPLEFLKTINTGVSQTTVEVKDNELRIEVKTDTVYKDRIVYRDRTKTVEKDVVRYKIPFWVWIYIVASALAIIILIRFNKWL